MNRLPKDYTELEEFTELDKRDYDLIESRARVCSFTESLDAIGVLATELDEETLAKAKRVHRRGRAEGIHIAGERLFNQMQLRNGGQYALDYLKKHADDFKLDVSTSGNNGFKFNIVLDESE